MDLTLEDVKPYIDWNFFFTAWDMKGKYPEILSHPQKGEAARDLFEGGKKMLEEVMQDQTLSIKAIAGFWPAYSEGDDLIIQDENEKRFCFIRQQRDAGKHNYCLADFVAPQTKEFQDHVGAFLRLLFMELKSLLNNMKMKMMTIIRLWSRLFQTGLQKPLQKNYTR